MKKALALLVSFVVACPVYAGKSSFSSSRSFSSPSRSFRSPTPTYRAPSRPVTPPPSFKPPPAPPSLARKPVTTVPQKGLSTGAKVAAGAAVGAVAGGVAASQFRGTKPAPTPSPHRRIEYRDNVQIIRDPSPSINWPFWIAMYALWTSSPSFAKAGGHDVCKGSQASRIDEKCEPIKKEW
jgi:hypothetical protein